jgi:antitoxin component YwqK of YwqJK toxin-antitoxin module
MKLILLLFLALPVIGICQPEIDTTDQRMITMAETYQKAYNLGGIYYETGSKKPYTGILYGRYDNGKIMTMQEYKNGIGNGTWIQFDPEGRKEVQGTYIDNKVEGPVTLFYEDGNIKAKGQYRHWKQPIGEWIYYDRKGKMVHKMTYTP